MEQLQAVTRMEQPPTGAFIGPSQGHRRPQRHCTQRKEVLVVEEEQEEHEEEEEEEQEQVEEEQK